MEESKSKKVQFEANLPDDFDSHESSNEIGALKTPIPNRVRKDFKTLNIDSIINDNLNKIPPNVERAKYHGALDKVWLTQYDKETLNKISNIDKLLKTKKVSISDENKWSCCKDKLRDTKEIERFSFWTSISSFKIFGTGIPMFFNFMIFVMVFFAFLSLVVAIPSITINILEDNNNGLGNLTPSFLVHTSLGNHGITAADFKKSTPVTVIMILNLIGIIIMFIGYRLYRWVQISKIRKIDEDMITPSDFTVMAFNINRDVTKEQLKKVLEVEHNAKGIEDIIFCYNINEIVELLRKKIIAEK